MTKTKHKRFVLAKKLMVTKLNVYKYPENQGFVLAKKLMVTKRAPI